MVNINEIKTIEDAKKVIYDGEELTEQEKDIFDSSSLKENDGGVIESRLQDAMTLLDKLKKAKKIQSSNDDSLSGLLNDMRRERNQRKTIYAVVNYDGQIDKEIIRLESLR